MRNDFLKMSAKKEFPFASLTFLRLHCFGLCIEMDLQSVEGVRLNVYDLSPQWNAWGFPFGFGAFHSGLELYGRGPRRY